MTSTALMRPWGPAVWSAYYAKLYRGAKPDDLAAHVGSMLPDVGRAVKAATGADGLQKIRDMAPVGIVLSGGPSSVYDEGAPKIPAGIYELGVPVLGICYGAQLVAKLLGGEVEPADKHEYGRAQVTVAVGGGLFEGIAPGESLAVWMSHGDRVRALPAGFRLTGESPNSPRNWTGSGRCSARCLTCIGASPSTSN